MTVKVVEDIFLCFQGNAGVGLSLLIVVITLLVALVPVLSAIGVCERCHVGNGGVYFLLSHVLGQRAGGAVGVMYAFGQVAIMIKIIVIGDFIMPSFHYQDQHFLSIFFLFFSFIIQIFNPF